MFNDLKESLKKYASPQFYLDEFRSFFGELKKEPERAKKAVPLFANELKAHSSLAFRGSNLKLMLLTLLTTVIIGLAISLLCSIKQGGMDLFMTVMIPFVAVSMFFFVFTVFYESSIPYAALTVVLLMLGVALQVMLLIPDEADKTPTASALLKNAILGLVIALIAVPFFYYIFNHMNKRVAALITLGAALLLYFILLVKAPNNNGTRAWIYIGGRSFQLTELTKLLAVMSLACIFTDSTLTPGRRLIRAIGILAAHALCLIVINELGTLIVICIVFIVLGFSFQPSIRGMLITIAIGILGLSVLLSIGYKCYEISNRIEEQEAIEALLEEQAAEQAEAEAQDGEEAEEAADAEEAEAAEDGEADEDAVQPIPEGEKIHLPAPVEKIVNKGAMIFYKVKIRFDLITAPETVDEYNEGYQAKMARKAMLVTNWLGTNDDYEQNVPVIESDYIFLYVLMKIGIIGAFVVLMMLMIMLIETVLRSASNPRMTEGAAAIGFICCIVVQSIVTGASSVGLIPTVGLTFAFLSDGGSATVANYMMTFFILYSFRKEYSKIEAQKPEIKKEERAAVCRTTE